MSKNINQDVIFGDNITGSVDPIVPNIVHNILFGYNEIKFSHFICLLSVLKNQKPDVIYIHCNCDRLTGPYYQWFYQRLRTTNTFLKIRTIEQPIEIFGRKINKEFLNWHSADITRLRVLTEFGGIYLDNDVYVVKSLDKFRHFEMTVNRYDDYVMSNAAIIAHKNSRFLRLWIESYKNHYDPSQWFYNGGVLPTRLILEKKPYLAHRLNGEFGIYGPIVGPILYSTYYKNWRTDFYVFHLNMRGNTITNPKWVFKGNYPHVLYFNETVVQDLNNTFGEMCRDLNIQ